MGANFIPRRVLHLLLRLPSPLRPPHPLHLPGGPQRSPLQGHEDRPDQPPETLQREQEIRMQEAQRLQLHHAHVNRSRNCVPHG